MDKRTITVAGAQVRVEANWKAITAFLRYVGRDTLQGLSDLANLSPSDMAPLMAACLNEGARLEGLESSYSPEWIEENVNLAEMTEFVQEFLYQITPKLPKSQEKKD